MKAERGYKQYIDWDQEALRQGYEPEWVEDIGVHVGHYLAECIQLGRTPTFDGFFAHLSEIAPKREAEP